MSKLSKLTEERASKLAAFDELRDGGTDAKPLTEEDETELRNLSGEISKLDEKITTEADWIERASRLGVVPANLPGPYVVRDGGDYNSWLDERLAFPTSEEIRTALDNGYMERALGTGTDAAGGYLVSKKWDERWFDAIRPRSIMLKIPGVLIEDVAEQGVGSVSYPVLNKTIGFAWTAESGTIAQDDPDLRCSRQ